MYHYLNGRLIEKSPTQLVLETGGIGYQVQIPVSTYSALPETGQTVRILTHFVVREDAQALYGFLTEEERRIFKLLISVSGIGPKMAMTALSGISVPELKKAIVEGSLAVLTGISGIGRKTAERIVVELREKLVLEGHDHSGSSLLTEKPNVLVEDSLQALVALGYRRQNAKEALQKVLKNPGAEKLSVEELIRASLKYV